MVESDRTMKTGVPASDVMSMGFIPSSLKCLANPKSASLICTCVCECVRMHTDNNNEIRHSRLT